MRLFLMFTSWPNFSCFVSVKMRRPDSWRAPAPAVFNTAEAVPVLAIVTVLPGTGIPDLNAVLRTWLRFIWLNWAAETVMGPPVDCAAVRIELLVAPNRDGMAMELPTILVALAACKLDAFLSWFMFMAAASDEVEEELRLE
uniref:Uncharacterized protein n=1 Tax=Hyaloperonospora arabidopsidis (strain Emoy2) TaxID=559515 RepID=M4BDE2_HYAAE